MFPACLVSLLPVFPTRDGLPSTNHPQRTSTSLIRATTFSVIPGPFQDHHSNKECVQYRWQLHYFCAFGTIQGFRRGGSRHHYFKVQNLQSTQYELSKNVWFVIFGRNRVNLEGIRSYYFEKIKGGQDFCPPLYAVYVLLLRAGLHSCNGRTIGTISCLCDFF